MIADCDESGSIDWCNWRQLLSGVLFFSFPIFFSPNFQKIQFLTCGVAKLYWAGVNVGVGYDGVGYGGVGVGGVHLLVLQSSTGLAQDWGGAKAKVCQALDLIWRYLIIFIPKCLGLPDNWADIAVGEDFRSRPPVVFCS